MLVLSSKSVSKALSETCASPAARACRQIPSTAKQRAEQKLSFNPGAILEGFLAS